MCLLQHVCKCILCKFFIDNFNLLINSNHLTQVIIIIIMGLINLNNWVKDIISIKYIVYIFFLSFIKVYYI